MEEGKEAKRHKLVLEFNMVPDKIAYNVLLEAITGIMRIIGLAITHKQLSKIDSIGRVNVLEDEFVFPRR